MHNRERVVITGVGGYIGSSLAGSIRGSYSVVGVSRGARFHSLESLFGDTVKLVRADIADTEGIKKAAEGARVIVHGAGPVTESFCREQPEEARRVIVEGTRGIADIARSNNALLVYLSTLSVYPAGGVGESLTETINPAPDSVYGRLKAEAESIVRSNDAIILRLAHIYGKSPVLPSRGHLVTDIFVDKAVRGEPIVIYGDGSECIDLVHIRDVVRLISLLIESRKAPHPIMNVTAGEPVTINRLAEEVQNACRLVTGKELVICHEPFPQGKSHKTRILSAALLRTFAPWLPSISLEEGIGEMVSYRYANHDEQK